MQKNLQTCSNQKFIYKYPETRGGLLMTYSDSCVPPRQCDTEYSKEWKSEGDEPNTPSNKISKVVIDAKLRSENLSSSPIQASGDLNARIERFDSSSSGPSSLEVNYNDTDEDPTSSSSNLEEVNVEIAPVRERWKTVSREIQKGLKLIHFISMDKTTEAKEFLNGVSDLNILNQYNESPILCAAHRDNAEMVQALAEKGANLNLQDVHGNTALIIATKFGYLPSIATLLTNEVNVDLPDTEGSTPLMWAFKPDAYMNFDSKLHPSSPHPRQEIVRLLVENDAELNAVDKHHMTALAYALCSQDLKVNLDLILLLVEQGAKLVIDDFDDLGNKQGYWQLGATALLHAARAGHEQLAKTLISKGVHLGEKNLSGETPIDLALANGHYEIAKLIREAQKSTSIQEIGSQTEVEVTSVGIQAKSQSRWKGVRNTLFGVCSDTPTELVPHNGDTSLPQT
ncbi:MAG: ankyrin repeat protein [Halioglobus sp.]